MLNNILLIIGIIIIPTSFYFIKKESLNLKNSYEAPQHFQEIVNSINTIEEIIDEMNNTYYEIIKDLEEKYLFIYEKYRECNERYEVGFKENKNEFLNNSDNVPIKNSEREEFLICKDKILSLKEKGYSISQIAKELNKGKGEIQLFLTMRQK